MLPDSAAGGSDTDVLDGWDPSGVAPPDPRTDTGGDTDTFVPTDTGNDTDTDVGPGLDSGTGPGSDTDQDTGVGTDTDQVTDTPPATDTPPVTRPPATDRPPATTPDRTGGRGGGGGGGGGGIPPRWRLRDRRPDPDPTEAEPRPDVESGGSLGFFGTRGRGSPASSYFSETLTALALGGFAGDRAPAEGTEGEFIGGAPTQAAADAEGDDAEAFENVSGLFFGVPLFGASSSEENSESGFSLL